MSVRISSTILILLITAPALYEPVSSRPVIMPVQLPKEAAYFRKLERISTNPFSARIHASLDIGGTLYPLEHENSVSIDYGARVTLYVADAGGKPLTGCKMSRAEKKAFHITMDFPGDGKPITIRAWTVGKVRLYFTFGEKGSTEAVYVLNLTVTPRNKKGLTTAELEAKP